MSLVRRTWMVPMCNALCKCGRTSLVAGVACLMCLSAGLGMASRFDYEITKYQIKNNLLPVDSFAKPVRETTH